MEAPKSLQERLRELAERSFPDNAISQDPQTLSYGEKNQEFLRRCQVDLDLSELDGFGSYAFHLNAEGYSVLVARTLLKYMTLFSGSKNESKEALSSKTLASFLAFFQGDADSKFLTDAMSVFDSSEISTLKESCEAIIAHELSTFGRDVSYLDEVESFVAWIDTHRSC